MMENDPDDENSPPNKNNYNDNENNIIIKIRGSRR